MTSLHFFVVFLKKTKINVITIMISIIECLSIKIGTKSIFCKKTKKNKSMVRTYLTKRKYGIARVVQKSRWMITWYHKWL